MTQVKRSRRTKTLSVEPSAKLSETLHDGMNYFHELNMAKFKIRRKKKVHTWRSQSAIEETQIYQTLKDNKIMLDRIKTETNQIRDFQFNDYLKKSTRYQELLNINDNKKKRLATLNAKVGAVIRKSAMEVAPKQIIYNLFISNMKIQGWKPESREGHSAIINAGKEQLILIGGHCSHPFSTIHVYSFYSNTWVKQIPSEIARSYHSTVIYKNRFAINFGGMGVYNKSRKVRDCHSSITLMDMLNYTTKNIKMHNEESVQPRRCHSAVLLGKFMLVFGGINSKKQYLNDFIYLDLKELRWYHKEYKVEGRQLQSFLQFGIAKHCAFSTFKPRKSYSFYSSDYDQNQTIYFIGGFNQNQEQNIVFQLLLNKYVPTFRKVEFLGNPPSPVSPIIQKYSNNPENVLVVSGEMSDREIRLFKTREKSFTLISHYINMHPLGGTGSSLSLYNGSYYFFFGLGEEGYIGQITKFQITEQKKENQKKAKLSFTKQDFLIGAHQLSNTSSDDDRDPFPYK